MRIEPGAYNLVSIKMAAANLGTTVKSIENNWNKAIPNRPFDYYFLDEFLYKQYSTEDNFGNLFLNFAVLAIFISCLGLLGLASYTTLQRTKEIGVRKVLGASVSGIVGLLSKDFLKLVVMAICIAIPIAWLVMHQWLQGFAYRITIGWWIFAAAGILAILVAVTIVSLQAMKAALMNPVKSLRME